jgi:hypothetical protein
MKRKTDPEVVRNDEPALSVRCSRDDPYRTLDDLMCVIEALCPVWPQKPPRAATRHLIL